MINSKVSKAMITATDRHNSNRRQRLIVFYKAVEMIKKAKQWSIGESRILFEGILTGRKARVYLRNENSGINLYLFVEGPNGNLMKRFYSEPFRVGYFDPAEGFKVSIEASEANYLRWNFETRKAMG